MMKNKLILCVLSATLLSACSTLDAINPFDKTEAEKRAEQGEVAGEDQRISILELSETLTLAAPMPPEQIIIPDPYVNTDWPQTGGNVQHVVQHTGATGPLDRAWSIDIGEGSGRKGRVIAPPVIAGGKIFTVDARYKVSAFDEQSGNELWDFKVEAVQRESTREGKTSFMDRIRDPLTFTDGDGSDKVLWSYQGIIETASMLTAPAPAVVDDVVVTPFSSGELIALRVQNGGVLWQDSLSSTARLTPLASLNDIAGGPAVADGYVIATAQSGVMTAFDLRTGQRVWSQPELDGTVLWIKQLENFKNEKKRKERTVWTGPILAGNRLVVGSSRGDVKMLDPRSGEIIKEMSVKAPLFVPPVIANETVYLLTDEAKLVALK